ncbi:hypothetical protein G6L37_01920 [Agrobacterium rubi]|nr:hypothetical protein [Agrobacterium rubi]NTF24150.1 hypothetical protein [Agrobacterium rubi]
MSGFEVTLEDHGLFLVPAMHAYDSDRKIGFDSELPRRPWVITQLDLATCRWERADSFATLDEALNFAVCEASGLARPNFRVRLPCGQHFSRPGHVPAEAVLSSLGWVYVTHLVGFSHFLSDTACTPAIARRHFLLMTKDTPNVVVGDVTPNDEDGNRLWIADLHIPFDGFIRREDIESEKNISFAAEGIPLVEGFDCTIAVGGEVRSADLISLADHVAARQMQAA